MDCKLVFCHKILKGLAPLYLRSYLLHDNEITCNTRSCSGNTIKAFATRTSVFRATFFPYCTNEWNQLNDDFKKIESIKKIEKTPKKVIRTKENFLFGVSDVYDIKLLARLKLNFSHLNEHKFRHHFNHMINPMCNCGAATETTIHYLFRTLQKISR